MYAREDLRRGLLPVMRDAVSYARLHAMVCVSGWRLRGGFPSGWFRVCWWQTGYQATGDKERGWPMAALKTPLRLTRFVSRAKEQDRGMFSL